MERSLPFFHCVACPHMLAPVSRDRAVTHDLYAGCSADDMRKWSLAIKYLMKGPRYNLFNPLVRKILEKEQNSEIYGYICRCTSNCFIDFCSNVYTDTSYAHQSLGPGILFFIYFH